MIKDFGCVKDYVKAIRAEGVEKRKMLSDLVTYGCIQQFELMAYEVESSDRQAIISPGGPAIVVWKVTGHGFGSAVNHALYGENKVWDQYDKALDSHQLNLDGWILDKEFLRVAEAEVVDLINKAKTK